MSHHNNRLIVSKSFKLGLDFALRGIFCRSVGNESLKSFCQRFCRKTSRSTFKTLLTTRLRSRMAMVTFPTEGT